MLKRHYADRFIARYGTSHDQFQQIEIDSAWMVAVHDALYKDIKGLSFDVIAARHAYLRQLGELVAHASFTVNFNFDDIVDEAAFNHVQVEARSLTKDKKPPSPEVIWRPKVENRRGAPVIYHVNGYLPRESIRRKSDFLTLTEDAFADILVSPNSSDTEFVASRFASMTFLLLGTSLGDNSLKNMLRIGAIRSPANHHYIIYWEDAAKQTSASQRADIFGVNLEVYNLISIFLTTNQISEFLSSLNETTAGTFEGRLARLYPGRNGPPTRRRYYLVGAIASGKSSNLELLRCFNTFEEWFGRPPALMYQSHTSLSPEARLEVDEWVLEQLCLKNDSMHETGPGIHIMDRAFLDLFAFSQDDSERFDKATKLEARVSVTGNQIQPGQIIFLKANEEAYKQRLARRGKLRGRRQRLDYDPSQLIRQTETIEKIYNPEARWTIDTSSLSPDASARAIARRILVEEPYSQFDFSARIRSMKSDGGAL
jgi:hypothetical protein